MNRWALVSRPAGPAHVRDGRYLVLRRGASKDWAIWDALQGSWVLHSEVTPQVPPFRESRWPSMRDAKTWLDEVRP